MVNECYQTILADPPWPYSAPAKYGNPRMLIPGEKEKGARLAQHGAGSRARYGAMTMDDLKALPVESVAQDNAHLYLWFTNSFAVEAHELARAWGFKPTTIITWTKTRAADGQPSMKMGYYYRGATEHILFATRGRLRLMGPAAPTAILSPRLPHSQKPECSYEMIEAQSRGPRLELFARSAREGWDGWGNQAPNPIQLPEVPHA